MIKFMVTLSAVLTLAATAAGAGSAQTARWQLRSSMVRSGAVAGLTTRACPIAIASASEWDNGDRGETAELARDGFVLGLSETLFSPRSGVTVSESVARFATSSGAHAAAAWLRAHAAVQKALVFAAGDEVRSLVVRGPATASYLPQLVQAGR